MTRDHLNAIRNRHLRPEAFEGKTFYLGHILTDMSALVDEMEALLDDKAKIVEWLRSHPPIRYGEPDPMSTKEIARCIESGEYLRAPKP
jgi:hypothetical protein